MANYIAYARTSYFKVKDEKAFLEWVKKYDIEDIWEKDDNGEKMFAMSFGMHGIPNWDLETDEDVNFAQELAKHLQEDWAVELREIGYEKMRYLVGYSIIVRWDGKEIFVNLDDLGHRAMEEWPDLFKLTEPSY